MTGVIKYPAGNSYSVIRAIQALGEEVIYSDEPEMLGKANRVIFPGVGSAGPVMESLRASDLDGFLKAYDRPILGICLGMQLMMDHSEEGDVNCLGLIPGTVRRFESGPRKLHTGWNELYAMTGPLFRGMDDRTDFYFVHQYFVDVNSHSIAHSFFGSEFSAAIQSGNRYGVQFHPEKSAGAGRKLLENFISL